MLDTVGDRTLTDLITERADAYGERTFLVYEDRAQTVTETTYRAFADLVGRCAAGLAETGVARGDCVVVHLRNSRELLVIWFALARLAAVFVPSNVANTQHELEHVIGFTEARLVITEPDLLEPVEQAVARLGAGIEVVVARGGAGAHRAFDELMPEDAEVPPDAAGGNDVVELIFTSGTTRKPKAVMLTHGNCLRGGLDTVHCLWLDERDRLMTALPLFHVNAQALSALAAMTTAGTLILLEEFRASRFWSQARAHGATQTAIVAMQLRTLLAQPPDAAERDHAIRRLFFAINVTDDEKERFEARFGVTLINGYGLSEAMTLLCCSPVIGPRRWPSIGLPSPGRRLVILDDDGDEAPPGQVGQIAAYGVPGRDVMLGYYRDDEATAAALRDGLLYTGDNAYADEQGFLYFFDRKKDMIKRAGENVSAMEVEGVLAEHALIAEASVIGVPDEIRDEAVAAIVVLTETGAVSAEEVIEHCRARLSKFKVPTVVWFTDELPKTSIGKVRKDELRKRFAPPAGASTGPEGPS